MGTLSIDPSRVHRVSVFVALAMALSSCGAPRFSTQTATASDEWSRTFPLDATGEVQILNISGVVTVDASPGTSVEVHAERVAHAATEQVARDFLTHVSIKDESTPNSVTVQTEPIAGVFIGVHFEVNYRVRVPASASVKVRTSNGDVTVTGVGGHVSVNDANGNVVGRLIGRGFDAHSTNGRVDVEIEKPTDDPIELRTVNGGILLTLPPSMDANLSASAVNGRANVTGLKFQLFGDPPGRNDRRLRGRINAGGPPIELNTVNGDIRVRAHE